MKLSIKRIVATTLAVATLALGATACDNNAEMRKRQEQAAQSAQKNSLEKANLKKKLSLEENPNQTGYVYLVTFGKPFGYYAIKGKVSNSGSQVDPENLVTCPYSSSSSCVVVDGPQDDGTYGAGDPGIFFFTTDGTMVTTSLDYVYSTQPLPSALDVPKLG